MPLELLPVTEADIPRINEIIFQSFESDYLHVLIFPREHLSSYSAFMHEYLRSKLPDPTVKSLKVVDSSLSGEASIVGYTRWKFPSGEDQNQNHQANSDSAPPSHQGEENDNDTSSKTSPTVIPFPEHANKPLWDCFGGQIMKLRGQFVDPARDFVLEFLATDPRHQGRGIGRIMLKYGLDELDRSRSGKAYLESTAAGMPIYEKYGFDPLGSIEIPLKELGVGDIEVYMSVVMGRNAR